MAWNSNSDVKGWNQPSSIDRSISNYQTRLSSAGQPIPAYKESSGFSALGNATLGILNNLDRLRSGTMNAMHYGATGRNALSGFGKGFTKQEDYTGQDVMNALGVKNKAGRFIGGVATEMLFDPLSYTTLGLGSLAKGVATGTKATMSAGAMTSAARVAETKALDAAKKALLQKHKAYNLDTLTRKLGGDADDYIKQAAYKAPDMSAEALRIGRENFLKSAGEQAQKEALQSAGRGLSFAGKTIVSGGKLQDIGAGTRNLPVIGAALRAGDDTVGAAAKKLFSTTGTLTGLDAGQKAIYKGLRNSQSGGQALGDVLTSEVGVNLAKLQKGATVNLASTTRTVDEFLPDFISMGGTGLNKYERNTALNTVLTTDASKKRAAMELGLIKNMDQDATVQDLAEFYMRQFKRMGIQEEQAGVLKQLVDRKSTTKITDKMNFSTYFPRVMSRELDARVRKGGMTRNLNVNNVFANRRNPEYEGLSIAEINKQIRDKQREIGANVPDDFKFFETSALNAYMSRALSSNKMLADKSFTDNVVKTFGTELKSKAEIAKWIDEGYDIVVPSAKLNVFRADPDLKRAVSSTAVDDDAEVVIQKVMEAKDALKRLSYTDAVSFIGQSHMPKLYAMPQGIAQSINAQSAQQIDNGVKTFKKMMQNFHGKWKPLVTGLRPAYHARNAASSTFNNILDLGTNILDKDVQAAALAVTGDAARNYFGSRSAKTFNIGGKSYTADSLKKLMTEHGALNTFMLTDADTLARGMADDVARRASSKVMPWERATSAGRAVGNRTEEYVRATNFIAHLKMGHTPAQAAESVRKFHFDYQDITDFEQNLKMFLPFYTWMRKNMPLQMENLLNNPRAYLALDRMGETGAAEAGLDYSTLPDYIQENMAIPMGRTEDGRVRMFDAGLPVSDLYTGGKDVLSMLSPALKIPLEMAINKNLMTGQPLRDYDEEMALKFLQGDSPAGRLVSKSPMLSQAMLNNPNASAWGLHAAKNLTGVMGDVSKYAAPIETSGVVQTNAQRNQMGGPLGAVSRMADPNFLKYVDQNKALENRKYAYSRQLSNTVQYLKDMGIDIETMNEIKKNKF